jgi:site-specific DNA-cytosine methylase
VIRGSLFTGRCDGIGLGLSWVGLGPLAWLAESDPWRREGAARAFPSARVYSDVRDVAVLPELRELERVDLVFGGFPCTGMSGMGKRKGFEDERSALWSEFARVLRVLRPALALVENTAAATVRGWLRVLGDLTELGFDAEWLCLRGTDVGWPVGRERVFLLACAGEVGREKLRAAHDLDGGDAPWDLAHRRGACRPPPGPDDLGALRAWAAEHGGVEPGLRRDLAVIPSRVDRIGALGDSAMPVLVAHAWRQLSARLLSVDFDTNGGFR